jgi:ABC-type sulfate transport system permease component
MNNKKSSVLNFITSGLFGAALGGCLLFFGMSIGEVGAVLIFFSLFTASLAAVVIWMLLDLIHQNEKEETDVYGFRRYH